MDFSCLAPTTLRPTTGQLGDELFTVGHNQNIARFDLPNVTNLDSFQREAMDMAKPKHGTTTLGFVFQGGVIIAVDSRATMGQTISSQTVKKVLEINDFILGTMAGGAADCQFWERNLGTQCRAFELTHKRRITVSAASKLLANTFYGYRGQGLSCATMVAGYDEFGPGLYQVGDDDRRIKVNSMSVGSGSIFAYGVMDEGYRYDLTDDEAVELGRRAIYHATYRDAMSGGTVSVYLVKKEGWKKMVGSDVGDLHYEYNPNAEATMTE